MFVCLGNICRSPAAEGVFRQLVQKEGLENEILTSSSGIGDWHIGQLPDPRIRQAAADRGVPLTGRARPFIKTYLDEFDYILAADFEVLEFLLKQANTLQHRSKIHLITAFSRLFKNTPIRDPYYAGPVAFEETLDILEEACQGLLDEILRNRPDFNLENS